jgi:hypothetical protein
MMIRLNHVFLILCVIGTTLSFKIVDLPYANNCSNSDQIKALLSQASIIYGTNSSAQLTYIKAKIDRSMYPFWEIRVIKDKNFYTFA